MTQTLNPKVLVVGGGPGGYVAAIRAGQLGLDTVLVEGDRLGGTCLIRGCIPSKALIHAAGIYDQITGAARPEGRLGIPLAGVPSLDLAETAAWKESIVDRLNGGVAGLLRKAKVRVVSGWATFADAKTCTVETAEGEITIQAEHVILATGSVTAQLPMLPFGGKIIGSTEALSLTELPKRMVVVGGGYIGLELGSVFARFGSEVSVVEAQDRVLPTYDKQLTDPVKRWLQDHGIALHLGAKALGETPDGLEIETSAGEHLVLPADRILVTVGRRPQTRGLEGMALQMAGPFVQVNERCATSTTNVWAIGDLVGEPMLAHKASAQGEMVAEIIAGKRRYFDPVAIPAVCFTEPEIVAVGLGPDQVPEGVEPLIGVFPFQANGRALSMEAADDGGFVRVVARKSDHRILGIQAVGRHVSELSSQFATLLEMGAVLEDVAGVIHAHPTQGEAVHEASLKALGHAIHI
ncbi:dihydrolipoyl dehydrogenase [Paracoccus sp. S3-43]|uniref:dihydrolipoyl dehydrogenase n=1 Tax=Paracoccus sp. S3-43 TaxID=3030011 RepID=UPI0023AEA3D6|nr:dihydrolipoyl dehydrogenase [Paracoccus sp. S3-43]WEF24685.1 dihydrolipoyl dehydrogenase [Paracoccus sp. S3-43]